MSRNYYDILGVHPKASEEAIQAVYRVLAKKYTGQEDRLRVLIEAKEVLLNTKKRQEYDDARAKSPGKTFGQYRIIKQIAEGGFGKTYLAEHIHLKTPVCIKHALGVTKTDEWVLLQESRTMWDLRHHGIPAVRDIIRMPDDSLAMVMSYIPGPTLAEVIEFDYPDGIDPEHVAWITERLLNILKYLHLFGVTHGDVKPQNVIVMPESHNVVLVDYGLASLYPTAKSEAVGYTPYFSAPEQRDGKPIIPETDLYALGMTMVFALGGDVQFVKVPDTTPKHMCQFIKDLIRRDPLQRPKVWDKTDLTEVIKEVRRADFRRTASGMKPLKISGKKN